MKQPGYVQSIRLERGILRMVAQFNLYNGVRTLRGIKKISPEAEANGA